MCLACLFASDTRWYAVEIALIARRLGRPSDPCLVLLELEGGMHMHTHACIANLLSSDNAMQVAELDDGIGEAHVHSTRV